MQTEGKVRNEEEEERRRLKREGYVSEWYRNLTGNLSHEIKHDENCSVILGKLARFLKLGRLH